MKIFENVKFDDNGLIPAIIQDDRSLEVLTLCYMNREALRRTLEEGKVYVYRRSKSVLMMKGQTSGCTQAVKSVFIDCEGNSILFRVEQKRAGCHKGYFTCYFRKMDQAGDISIVSKRIFDPDEVYKKSNQ
jgi:phosphoribosyl-AMP cyclohydrolase